jgi:glutamate N-acetyltransferase/amino-acid N-acetyltransferase
VGNKYKKYSDHYQQSNIKKACSMIVKNKNNIIVPGFLANGIHAGIKEEQKKDLSLILSQTPAKVAGVFTKNSFKAAPVLIDMKRIGAGISQVILTNSGNANAATGNEGYDDALKVSGALSRELKIKEELILLASTGVIGQRLPVDKIKRGIKKLVKGLRTGGIFDAEEAMMTTDKFPKIALRKTIIDSKEITLCGVAKGAGMIEPHMATMLAFFMTDLAIDGKTLDNVFRQAVEKSFNAISVDGCMSTNDSAIILANAIAENKPVKGKSKDLIRFKEMLYSVMLELSQAMVRDGEGATKVIEISVEGAASNNDAKKVAYAIANSNLVKTAFFGNDPNWGRIISAVGSVGIRLSVNDVQLYFGELPVFGDGKGMAVSKKDIHRIVAEDYIKVRLHLGMGIKSHCIRTSDLSFDYVKINAHYHT